MLSLNSFGSVANRNSRLWSYLRRVQEAIDSKTNWNLLSTQFLASLRAISDCTDAAVPIDLKQSFVFFVNNRNAMVMSVEFQLMPVQCWFRAIAHEINFLSNQSQRNPIDSNWAIFIAFAICRIISQNSPKGNSRRGNWCRANKIICHSICTGVVRRSLFAVLLVFHFSSLRCAFQEIV